MRMVVITAVAMLGGCWPDDQTALDVQREQARIAQARDDLHEAKGEARGYYTATALVCAQKLAQSVDVLKRICSKHEPAFEELERLFTVATHALNAAQATGLAVNEAIATVDALENAVHGVHGLMEEATDAVASGGGEWIDPSVGGAGAQPTEGAPGPEADADPGQVGEVP